MKLNVVLQLGKAHKNRYLMYALPIVDDMAREFKMSKSKVKKMLKQDALKLITELK